jgi:mRNA interferase RelE/StbE
MFEIFFENQPEKFLNKVSAELNKRLTDKIEKLGYNPVPSDARLVVGRKDKTFRIRVGDYRILYLIINQSVLIVKIEKRSKVYD